MLRGDQKVVFGIGKELFGVGIDIIREILKVPDMTEVPDSPDFLEGVINLRGKIVPVIDLRKRLRLNGADRTRSTRVLIAEESDRTVGLIVDSVTEVIRIQPDDVEKPPEMITAIGIEYITGVAKVDEKLIILLDLKRVLSSEEMKRVRAGEMEVEPQPL
jgi:purine-binding chemotaxis protein CheW